MCLPSALAETIEPEPVSGLTGESWRLQGTGFDLLARYARYWHSSDPARSSPAWLKLQRYFLRRRPPAALRQALLHMDVHSGNVLHKADGLLALIDWEYAGDGDVALELTALFCGNALPVADRERLLADYVRQMPGLARKQLRRQIDSWLP